MKALVSVAAMLLVLAGCGGDDETSDSTAGASISPTAAESATPSQSTTPSPSKPPQVSEKTTCDLIFDTDAGATLFDTILDFITRDSNTLQQAHKVDQAIQELHEIASSATPTLGAQINAFADEGQKILDAARAGSTTAADTTALRASGLEVANTCQGYY